LFEEKAMGLPRRDIEYHTYADYCSWPDDVRYELIDGVAYAMGPAPVRRHQGMLLELARQVANILDGSPCRPYIAPFDVRLPKTDEIDNDVDTVVQPDLVVICDRAKLDDKGCRGAPDWVVEVLSPSTAGHDQILKRALYQRVGVREYWLVHPVDRIVTIYTLDAGSYGAPDVRELVGTLAVGVLPEIVIDWERVVRELDD
jgi:Uma2 family endonuclease